MNIYTPQKFAKMIGVSTRTLQRWDGTGKFKANRSPTGKRYYTHKQYLDYMGESSGKNDKTIIYARVSTTSKKDDLRNQIEFLKQYANAKGMIVDEILEDVGSGLNYNRKNWNKLLEDCILGSVKTILITHQDRFIRFGYEWFEEFLKSNGAEIIVVNNEKLSSQEEVVNDLISIMHEFSFEIYGLCKYRKQIQEDEEIYQEFQKRNKPDSEAETNN